MAYLIRHRRLEYSKELPYPHFEFVKKETETAKEQVWLVLVLD
jgi:hypothetical protein